MQTQEAVHTQPFLVTWRDFRLTFAQLLVLSNLIWQMLMQPHAAQRHRTFASIVIQHVKEIQNNLSNSDNSNNSSNNDNDNISSNNNNSSNNATNTSSGNDNDNDNEDDDSFVQRLLRTCQQLHQAGFVCPQVFLGMVEVLRDHWFPGVNRLKLTATTQHNTSNTTDNNNSNNNDNKKENNGSNNSNNDNENSSSNSDLSVPMNERQAYVSCVMASLLQVPGVPDTLAKTFLATCVFTSGVSGTTPTALKHVMQLCGCSGAPLYLLSAHMDGIVAVLHHHIKTSGHYLADLIAMPAFVEFVEKIYGKNWKRGVLKEVIKQMTKAIEAFDLVVILPEAVCYAAILAAVTVYATQQQQQQSSELPMTKDDVIEFLQCHVPAHHHAQLQQARALATRLQQLKGP